MIRSSRKLSLDVVRQESQKIRSLLEETFPKYFSGTKVDVMGLVQMYADYMAVHLNKVVLHIVSDEEMVEFAGETNTQTGCIYLPERTLLGALKGNSEDVFTVLHELGHHFLHQGVRLHRVNPGSFLPLDNNPEDQADSFVFEFLATPEFVRGKLKRGGSLGLASALGLPLYKVREHVKRLADNGDLGGNQLEIIF